MNEKGVEAASVTMVGVVAESAEMPPTDKPVPMKLDHPFQFFIYDKSEGLALFEGRLGGEPTLPETTAGTTKAPPAATKPGSEEQSSTTSTTSSTPDTSDPSSEIDTSSGSMMTNTTCFSLWLWITTFIVFALILVW